MAVPSAPRPGRRVPHRGARGRHQAVGALRYPPHDVRAAENMVPGAEEDARCAPVPVALFWGRFFGGRQWKAGGIYIKYYNKKLSVLYLIIYHM